MTLQNILNRSKRAYRLLLIVLGFSLFFLLVRMTGISFDQFLERVSRIGYPYLILMYLFVFGGVFLTSLKWEAVLKDLAGLKDIRRTYLLYYASLGIASSLILPHLGNYGAKTVSLKVTYRVPLLTGALSIFIEQIFDLFTICLMFVFASLYFLDAVSLKSSLWLLCIFSVAFGIILKFFYKTLNGVLIAFFDRLSNRLFKIPFFRNRFAQGLGNLRRVTEIRGDTMFRLFCYAYLKQLCSVAKVSVVLIALRIEISFPAVLLALPLVQMFVLVSLIPAGIGTLEAGWFGLLTLMMVDRPDIGMFLLVDRIVGDSATILITFLCFLAYLIGIKPPHFGGIAEGYSYLKESWHLNK